MLPSAPEARRLATCFVWLMHGARAGLAALRPGAGGAAHRPDAKAVLGEEVASLSLAARRGSLRAGLIALAFWLV